jgi:polysaccharide deacetylase 2 family uncharacterized protein YibQ
MAKIEKRLEDLEEKAGKKGNVIAIIDGVGKSKEDVQAEKDRIGMACPGDGEKIAIVLDI